MPNHPAVPARCTPPSSRAAASLLALALAASAPAQALTTTTISTTTDYVAPNVYDYTAFDIVSVANTSSPVFINQSGGTVNAKTFQLTEGGIDHSMSGGALNASVALYVPASTPRRTAVTLVQNGGTVTTPELHLSPTIASSGFYLLGSGDLVAGSVFLGDAFLSQQGSSAMLSLSGGTLTTSRIVVDENAAQASGLTVKLFLGEGTLRAGATDHPAWISYSPLGGRGNVTVFSVIGTGSGMILDTNGRNMGIPVPLVGEFAGKLVKRGDGTLTLGGFNTYASSTVIEAGTLEVSDINNLGAPGNGFALHGGTLRIAGRTLTDLDTRTVDASVFTGAIDVADNGHMFTLSQSLGSNNATSLTKLGPGTLMLTGQNSWTGGTTVSDGTLYLAGQVDPLGAIGTIRGPLVIGSSATVDAILPNVLGYGEGARVDAVTIGNGGRLRNRSDGGLGRGIAYNLSGALMQSNEGVADPAAPSRFTFGGPFDRNTSVRVVPPGTSTIAGHIELQGPVLFLTYVPFTVADNATLNVPAAISSYSGDAGFTKLGPGLMALQAANTFTGDTLAYEGTLAIDHPDALAFSRVIPQGGTLSFRGIDHATFGGLSGPSPVLLQNTAGDAVSLTVNTRAGNGSNQGGALTGTGSLIKTGDGLLSLIGDSTYSGTTALDAGTLYVDGTTGTGAVGVAAGTTLSGLGRVIGTATVQAGGHVAPGSIFFQGERRAPLTFSAGLRLESGAVLDLELDANSDSLRISSGTFAAAGGVVINPIVTAGYGPRSYTLIDFTGASAGGIDAAQFTLGPVPPPYNGFLSVQGSTLVLTVTATPAIVTGTTVPPAGAYKIDQALDFVVHYDRAITVTGTPRINITLGTRTVFATYVSGSGSQDLRFRYTIVEGDTDTDGIALATAIDANGGTLRDTVGTDADLTLNATPPTAGILVDTTVPSVTAMHLIGAPPPDSRTISYTVTFSEPVTGVDAADFFIQTQEGNATGQIGAFSGNGANYSVVVNRIRGVGRLALSLRAGGSGIVDAAGNAIFQGFRTDEQFQANLAQRCHVRQAAAGANDGTSWANAYNNLQIALGDTGCTEIWVARGVYKPGIVKTATFQQPAYSSLLGGFAGTETTLAQRTPAVIAANPTVLSGDIDGNDAADADGVLSNAAQIAGTNSATVVTMPITPQPGFNDATLLDGFIITAADGGGALRCGVPTPAYDCAFNVNNVVFSGNRGVSGAAVYLSATGSVSAPQFTKILFRGNRATNSGGAVSVTAAPGAIMSPWFSNVVFSGNSAFNWGGAVDLNSNVGMASARFNNATFTGNSSDVSRGVIAVEAYGLGGNANASLFNTILWDGAAPEIVLVGNGRATIDAGIVQAGCPAGITCTNLIAGDPLLGALADHGGALPTPSLGNGSAALDTGTCDLADDMRGFARPQGAGCDIGAVELRRPMLSVSVVGAGQVSAGALPAPLSGSVANCTGTCTATYDGETQAMVTLTATADAQSAFAGWSGDCTGTAAAAIVAMDAPRTCTATFVSNAAATTLALTVGTNPSAYGNALTFTATVTPQPPATSTPNGNVEFFDGVTPIGTGVLVGNTATFSTSTLTVGAHALAAHYSGDANYAAAAQPPSAPLGQVVQAIQPVITWNSPAAIVYGTPLGAAQLDAMAIANGMPVAGTYTYLPPAGTLLDTGPAQPLAVTFVPADTTNYLGASASVTIDVGRAPLTVTGTVVQNKTYNGNATATLSGGTLVGVVPADAANVTLTRAGNFVQPNVGTGIAVIANYTIDGSAANQYTLVQPNNLTGDIAPATLTWHATPATIAYGSAPGSLTGTLDGFVNGESQATATTGTAAWTTPATAASPPGRYAIDGGGLTANFGNYIFVQDAANATALTIGTTATTTTLAVQPSAVFGEPVTLTATIALPDGNTGTPAGAVRFSEDGTPLPGCSGDVPVASGTATCTTTTLAVGIHQVVATFTPSDANTSGSSAQAQVSVSAAPTVTVVLNPQPWTSTLGNPVPADVSVTVVAPGTGVPTGTVTLNDGSATCTAALSGGTGNCAFMPTSAGTKTVDVLYTPDAASKTNYAVSGRLVALTVLPAQPGATLVSSSNPSVFGQPVTLTATVTPASGGVVPTGKAHFSIDAVEICIGAALAPTGVANAASATCTIPQVNLAVGDHAVQLRYDGDPNNLASTQSLTQTVNVAQTTTVVTPPASVVLGNTATIAVSVAANAPGGGVPQGSVALSLGTANCTATLDASGTGNCTLAPPAPAGARTLAAAYAGAPNFAASSDTATLSLVAPATTTTLAANPVAAVFGQNVTLTASVAVATSAVANGSVAFDNAGAAIAGCGAVALVNGNAQCQTAQLPVGAPTIHASYSPSDGDTANSSGSTNLTIAKAATATTLTAPGDTTLGNPVSVTATVAVTAPGAGTLSGTIAISDGGTAAGDRCTITLPATQCTLMPASAGTKSLSAVYTPDATADANFIGSSAKAVTLVVHPAQAGTTLTSSANPSRYGDSVTWTAAITPAAGGVIPTGKVNFNGASTVLCGNVSLVAGANSATAICTSATLSVGSHDITVTYAGDANNQASNAAVMQVIDKADQTLTFPAQTTPTRVFAAGGTFDIAPLATSATPNAGQPIVYTALTAACSVSGTTVTMIATGTCTLAADQAGDANYNAAARVTQSVGIGTAASAVTLAASTTTPMVGAPVTLTATVNGQSPTGTVTILDGGTVLCNGVALTTAGNTSTAACTTSFAAAGPHGLKASYSGDANNAAQASAPLALDVLRICTSTTLVATPDHTIVGQNLTLTATVTGMAQGCAELPPARGTGGSTPTGGVTFREGARTLGTATPGTDGIATLPLSTLGAGTHTLIAEYAGDAAFAPSQAQTTVVVGQPAAPQFVPALDRWTLALLAGLLGLAAVTAWQSRERSGVKKGKMCT